MTEKESNQLSRLCAVFIVMCHALEILVRKIEALALRERLYMARENKQAVNGIIQACRKIEYHMTTSAIGRWVQPSRTKASAAPPAHTTCCSRTRATSAN